MTVSVNMSLIRSDTTLKHSPHLMEEAEVNNLNLDTYISLLLKDLSSNLDPFQQALSIVSEGNVSLAKRYLSSFQLSEKQLLDFDEHCTYVRKLTEDLAKNILLEMRQMRSSIGSGLWNQCQLKVNSVQKALEQERFHRAQRELVILKNLLRKVDTRSSKTDFVELDDKEKVIPPEFSNKDITEGQPTNPTAIIPDKPLQLKTNQLLDIAIIAWTDLTKQFSSELKAWLRPTESQDKNISAFEMLQSLQQARQGEENKKNNAERALQLYFYLDITDRDHLKTNFYTALVIYALERLREFISYKEFDTAKKIHQDITTVLRNEAKVKYSEQTIIDFFRLGAEVYAGWHALNAPMAEELFESNFSKYIFDLPKQPSTGNTKKIIASGRVLYFYYKIQGYKAKNEIDELIRFYTENHANIENLARSDLELLRLLDVAKNNYNEALIQESEASLTELKLPSKVSLSDSLEFLRILPPYQVVAGIKSIQKRFVDPAESNNSLMCMYNLLLLLFDIQKPEEVVFTKENILSLTRQLRAANPNEFEYDAKIKLLEQYDLPVGVVGTLELFIESVLQSVSTTDLMIARHSIAQALEHLQEQRRKYLHNTDPSLRHIWHMLGDHWIQILVARQRAMSRQTFLTLQLQSDEILAQEDSSLVIYVRNIGPGVAQGINVALVSSDLSIQPGIQKIPILGQGDETSATFFVKPRISSGPIDIRILVRYLDTDNNPIITSEERKIVSLPSAKSRFPKQSPYVWGQPLIENSQVFFGRNDVFNFLQTRFWGSERNKIISLQGERRMGKTSILHQIISRKVFGNYRVVFFDMQGRYANIDSMHEFLFNFARRLRSEARLAASLQVEKSDFYGAAREYYDVFDEWLDRVEIDLESRDTQIIILIDEFEKLLSRRFDDNINVNQRLVEELLQYLRSIMLTRKRLNWIIAGSWSLIAKQRDYFSSLFGMAIPCWISYLKREDAISLIQEPVKNYLIYEQDAINRIIQLTGGHPFYIQILCDELFNRARENNNHRIMTQDVNQVIDITLPKITETSFSIAWASLSNPMSRKTLAAIAEAIHNPSEFIDKGHVLKYLQRKSMLTNEDLFHEVLDIENGEITRRELIENHPHDIEKIRLRSELFYRWLKKSKPLVKVLREER